MVDHALGICAHTTALIGVLSEARRWRGWAGKLRLLHSYVVERPYRNRIDFVLAIGHLGVRWYEMCGYAHRRIFAWGYFLERVTKNHSVDRVELPRHVIISYVGRCVRGKGIDTMLRALSTLQAPGWSLQIVGDGPQRQWLEKLASKLAIADHVHFLGIRKNAEVWSLLDETDLLVFPSGIDGWGAVVNEGLMNGVPVVCSDYCGAADLIRASGFGETFRAGSAEDLARVLC
jgi:glycosyltransferase involved in cell wall biosynthesis